MKKLLFVLGFLVVAVFAAAVAAPWLIDAGQYKAEIARRVSAATGRDVAIDGPVNFVLLPSPRVRAGDVRVVVAGAETPVTISASSVELDLGWGSLFGQALDITHLRVIEPRVTIAAARSPSAGTVPPLGPIAAMRIERTDIQNGRIVWSDPSAKTPRTIEQLQATILASPLASSIRITGSAVVSAVPVEFDTVVGDTTAGKASPVSLTLGVRPNLARATLRGSYDPVAQALRGRLQIEGGDLFAALETITTVDPLLAGVTSQTFSASGDLSWTPAGFAANDLVLQLGDMRANGGINATSGATLAVDVALAMTAIDLDKLSRLERRAAMPAAPSRPAETAAARIENPGRPAGMPPVDLTVDLGVDAVGLNGGTLRQVRLNAVLSRGDLVINQAAALLPGETEFTGFAQIALRGATPRVDGTLSARSDNLRGLLEWLGVDTKGVPAGRLRRFDGQARIEGTPMRLELTGINLAFDATRATGGIAIALGQRVGLGADIRVDQLNLDGYALAAEARTKDSGPPLLDRFDANLTFAAQTVTWGGEPLGNVSVDAMLQHGDVELRSAVIGDVAGARAEARGKIAAIARQPGAELDIAIRADDASRLLRLADLTALTPTPMELRSRVRTAPNGDLSFENLDLIYGESRVGGRASIAGNPRRLGLDLSASRLMLDALPRLGSDDGSGFGLDAVIRADTLFWSGYEVTNARVEAHAATGTPTSIDVSGKLFDGSLDFTVRPETPEHRKLGGTLTLRDADLKRGLSALLGTAAVSGRADLRAAFSVPARLGAELWNGLSGSIELSAHDGALAGIDLPLMRSMLDSNNPPADIVSVLGAGLHGGVTPFSALNATARVQQGALTLESLRIATPVGEATGSGGADLGRGTVDLSLTVPVAGGRVPPMELMVKGPVDEANIALDFSKLQRFLSRREARTPGQDGGSQ